MNSSFTNAKYGMCVVALAFSTAVMAEDFTFKLTGPELDIVGKGLGTQPFNDAAPVLQKLREQVAAQQVKPVEPVRKPADCVGNNCVGQDYCGNEPCKNQPAKVEEKK